MSPVRVTWGRTIGHARGLYTTALTLAGFLALVAAAFAFNFDRAEGGTLPLTGYYLWLRRLLNRRHRGNARQEAA